MKLKKKIKQFHNNKEGSLGYEQFATEKRIWEKLQLIMKKSKIERTNDELEWSSFVLKKLKFFRNLPRKEIKEACKQFKFMRYNRHEVVMDMISWKNKFLPSLTKVALQHSNSSLSLKNNENNNNKIESDSDMSFPPSPQTPSSNNYNNNNDFYNQNSSNYYSTNQNQNQKRNNYFYVIISGTVSVLSVSWSYKKKKYRKKNRSWINNNNDNNDRNNSPSPDEFDQYDDDENSNNNNSSSNYSTYREEERDKESRYVEKMPFEDGVTLCQLTPGDCFGEINCMKILEKDSRRYIWITRENTELLRLPISVYSKTFQMIHEKNLENRIDFLKKTIVPLFTKFKPPKLFHFAKVLIPIELGPRKIVCKQNVKPGKSMYFITKGELKMIKHLEFIENFENKPKKVVRFLETAVLRQGEYFGEMTFVNSKPRMFSVFTLSNNCKLLCLPKIDFYRFFGRVDIEMLKSYGSAYPTDKEMRKIYLEQKKWKLFKSLLVELIKKK